MGDPPNPEAHELWKSMAEMVAAPEETPATMAVAAEDPGGAADDTQDPGVVVTTWPDLASADYQPVSAPGEKAAYKAMLSSGGPNLFLRAVRDGETEIVLKLVEYGADVAGAEDGYQNSVRMQHVAPYLFDRNCGLAWAFLRTPLL
jgi:hypothetical protein